MWRTARVEPHARQRPIVGVPATATETTGIHLPNGINHLNPSDQKTSRTRQLNPFGGSGREPSMSLRVLTAKPRVELVLT
jgi:hypothetical protein